MFAINPSKILYQILGGLFVLSIVMGMAGIGVSQDSFHPEHPYLSFLRNIKFFKDREHSTYMSREAERNIRLSHEKQGDLKKFVEDKFKDQRFTLALQQDRQLPQAQSIAIPPVDRSREVRERLNDMRYRSLDTQARYRQLIDSQRFR